jgi:predicted ester cyclase
VSIEVNTKKSSFVTITLALILLAASLIFSWQQQNALGQQQQQENNNNSNEAVVIAFTKAFNDHNPKELDSVVAKNIVEHRIGVQSGINSTKQFLNSLITAFPDFHTAIEHILAEGDKVVVFTNTTGTHKGSFMFAPGIPPTGKRISFRTADLYRIANNKITEHWDVVEYLKMLQDLGAIKFNTAAAPPPTLTKHMNSSSMSSMLQRGDIAMGFNQIKIVHHFIATPTGGEIMIVAQNSNDNDTIKQIRKHVVDIQKDFSEGNFTKPFFIHAQQVPGTNLMAERKDLITYRIRQIDNGSVLLLTTNDQQLILAIHQFIAFQSTQHSGH